MRYAILSDIHSNLEALTAVLDELTTQRIDRYLCVGDLIGYGANPQECLARLQELEAVTVAGNHEWGCLGKLTLQWFNDAARQAIEWTRDHLGFTELDYLRRLPLIATEDSCTLVHGTLHHPERFEYLMEVAQAADSAKACRTLYCFVGHTHVPFVFEYDTARRGLRRLLSRPKELENVSVGGSPAERRYVVNPGSVGQPRDGDPRACYALLDTDAQQLSVHRVPYDVQAAQRKIREAELPELLAERLAVGR